MRIIRGKYGRRRFDVPSNISARPTTDFARENIFNVLENLTDLEDADCLDLFAGTGAISFEFLSRECRHVTAVEKAATQWRFISQVAQRLNVDNFTLIRGDVFRFVATCTGKFDVIFADPPYDLPRFGEIPSLILGSKMLREGTIFVIEHSRNYDFSNLPHFLEHRVYGSVNFSIFRIEGGEQCAETSSGGNAENEDNLTTNI
ncbi:16S rRNA (guanine(966)-N(2))-methyltransferase RsmD [Muribaculum sp.]|uniref:16S rRNA (guanine(966)-N(2))-methyltransferase RsmD n=1 Tax=Muribaculum sp. TaxID=1918611 RepID=UPI0023C04770|nr:16S rRNA (guanine(966)-N(2))-methyltransferase RsmD [Muribaculum sp.]MDE5704669.1 16S rRNA (guanine(966)-N(2))-methyltransferase RsmD [Muribaculum sp.]